MAASEKELSLEHEISFPFYAVSRMLIQVYREPLEELGLTYPQYLVMLVLWEQDGLAVNKIGEKLHLDSGTLTPVLKRLEANNFVRRVRSEEDERKVEIQLTYPGNSLKNRAAEIPQKILARLNQWEERDLGLLKAQVNKLIESLNQQ